MTQPTWNTPAGSIGTFNELSPVNFTFSATVGSFGNTLQYTLLNGVFPTSTSPVTEFTLSSSGILTGTSAQVAIDTVYSFTIRVNEYNGSTLVSIADRTFSLTIAGTTAPSFTTPSGSIGTSLDQLWFSYQIGISNPDPNTTVIVRIISGSLPVGLEMNTSGLIQGYADPVASSTTSSFTLEASSESGTAQRSFNITITPNAAPIPAIFNTRPPTFSRELSDPNTPYYLDSSGNIGIVSQDNYFIFKILGNDWTSTALTYNISAGSLPTGIALDNNTGYLYGTIESNYGSATSASTNEITCTDTSNLSVNQSITFSIEATDTPPTFGNIVEGTTYYVHSIVDSTHFKISASYGGSIFPLSNANGKIISTAFDLLIEEYNFTVQVTNSEPSPLSNTASFILKTVDSIDNVPIDPTVTWITDSYLGIVNNGSISTLNVQAIATSELPLTYSITSGSLPPDLQLLSTGEIIGNVSFETEGSVTPLGDTNTYTFTIAASNPDYPTLITASRTFTLDVYQKFDTPYENVYIKALLNVQDHTKLSTLTNTSALKLGSIIGGSGYTDGTYQNVTLTLYSGPIPTVYPTATIIVSGGTVVSVTPTIAGENVSHETIFTVDNSSIPGGSGFRLSGTLIGGSGYASGTYVNVPLTLYSGTAPLVYPLANIVVSENRIVSVTAVTSGEGVFYDTVFTVDESSIRKNVEVTSTSETTNEITCSDTSDLSQNQKIIFSIISSSTSPTFGNIVPGVTYFVHSITSSSTFKISTSINGTVLPLANAGGSAYFNNIGSGFRVSVVQTSIIPDCYVYRSSDPNFGKATDVIYQHIFGIPASTIQTYIDSLIYNHYWRNITLGNLKTAIARNDQNEIIYEVIYSEIIDNLVNDQGVSISKEVTWPRAISGYGGTTVYPNSLPNMRQQVADYIENQVTDPSILPLWMTSQQLDGGTLGFKPAWVICYTKPGYSEIIKSNIEIFWTYKLNQLAFELDRIEVNRSLTFDYNPSTPTWTTLPSGTVTDDSEDDYVYFPQKTIIG